MDLKKVQEIGEQISSDEKTKKAIFELIDLKINDDMEKILQRMDNIDKSFSKEIKIVYWVVGIAMGIIVVLLSILAFVLRK